jgi:hypothetical protein
MPERITPEWSANLTVGLLLACLLSAPNPPVDALLEPGRKLLSFVLRPLAWERAMSLVSAVALLSLAFSKRAFVNIAPQRA